MFFKNTRGLDGLILDAIGNSLAMIQFTPEGVVLDANENFLNALGYRLDEVVGKHHRIFCDRKYAEALPIDNSGPIWRMASRRWQSFGALANLARKYGSTRRIVR